MSSDALLAEIARFGVVPVISIDSIETVVPLADALLEGGLPLAEITFRTPVAVEAIARTVRDRPRVLVGAGTVLTEANLLAAQTAGARFAVAPGINPKVVRKAADAGIPFVPGICTPSEIEQALDLGCRMVKFFPAGPSGGSEMLKALAAPYFHTGIRFVPTGGINAANLEAYLSIDAVAAVGGTWIARPEDLAACRWQAIRDRCREAVEIVRRARGVTMNCAVKVVAQ